MSIIVEIPGLLKVYTGAKAEVEGEGTNVGELLEDLERKYPGLTGQLFNEHGGFGNLANIFVNEMDFHLLSELNTPLRKGDRVRLAVAPLISGGSGYDR